MLTKKNFLWIGIVTLLLGVGFFFRGSRSENEELKPSQVDFTKGNKPQDRAVVPTQSPKHEAMQLAMPMGLSEKEEKQWNILKDVLQSHNDNDPRVDQELKVLSPKLHEELRKTYTQLPMESRNSRGLIVFLIARDLQNSADAAFLKAVYEEPPCLSMADCSQAQPSNSHEESVTQTSLSYPQLAGLYQLDQKLERNPELLQSPEMHQEIADLLREARQFPNEALRRRAEEIQKKLGL
jgi:hypothetical protein